VTRGVKRLFVSEADAGDDVDAARTARVLIAQLWRNLFTPRCEGKRTGVSARTASDGRRPGRGRIAADKRSPRGVSDVEPAGQERDDLQLMGGSGTLTPRGLWASTVKRGSRTRERSRCAHSGRRSGQQRGSKSLKSMLARDCGGGVGGFAVQAGAVPTKTR